MRQIAVIPNLGKRRIEEILRRIFSFYESRDVSLMLPKEAACHFGLERYGVESFENVHVDMALSIGGDGTLLGACRRFRKQKVPVCGINLGTLGFLVDIEPEELEGKLGKILSGEYRVEKRLLLAAFVKNGEGEHFLGHAINDVVATKDGVARMLRLGLGVNGAHLLDCQADGMIVSTPTGSTAYSLSAGGPVLNPNLRSILLTPICAHTFQMRPIALDESDAVHITFLPGQQDVIVTLDGQESFHLSPGDEVIVRKSEEYARIVKFEDKNFYQLLRTKLWRNT